MSNTKTSRLGSIIAFTLSGLFIIVATGLFLNRQAVVDQLTVWSYQPSSSIASIQRNADLTDRGRFIFYATQPVLEQQDAFNQSCPRQETGSPILGCYTTNDRIYIYDLTNEQLDGMEEVTAVHEMLHAVWYRTSPEGRATLETELRAVYANIQDDDLKTRMQYYERTEPGEFVNELHSILGTEVAALGEPLETYYAQFFNRATVLGLHAKYNDVYKALYTRADVLYNSMETLAASIQSRSDAYEAAVKQYSSDVAAFNSRANNGGFTSQVEFNTQRATLLARSNALNAEREAINGDIVTYNNYYSEYKSISKQIEVLNQSVDSFNQIDKAPSV